MSRSLTRMWAAALFFTVWPWSCAAVDAYIQGLDVVFGDRPAVTLAQTTLGTCRTPAGRRVTVYGPSRSAVRDHDFEVEIPRPQVPLSLSA